MIPNVLRGLIAGGLVALVLFGVGVLALWPPASLEVPERGVVIADVTIVNPNQGARAHQTIRVSGSTIDSIAESSTVDVPPETRRYAGSYVLPGLIDLHVHHPIGQLGTASRGSGNQLQLLFRKVISILVEQQIRIE